MASHRKPNVRCPVLVFLVTFGALALLIPLPACSQNLGSQLLKAASGGETEKVKALLKAGADVDAKDNDGWTPLMLAASRGHTDTVQALLDAGADVNAKGDSSLTTLEKATMMGYTEIVELLKKAGAKE